MTPEVAVDLIREALWLIAVIVGLLVLPSLVVGLLVAMFQAATQINEQTLSFVPRLLDPNSTDSRLPTLEKLKRRRLTKYSRAQKSNLKKLRKDPMSVLLLAQNLKLKDLGEFLNKDL